MLSYVFAVDLITYSYLRSPPFSRSSFDLAFSFSFTPRISDHFHRFSLSSFCLIDQIVWDVTSENHPCVIEPLLEACKSYSLRVPILLFYVFLSQNEARKRKGKAEADKLLRRRVRGCVAERVREEVRE